MPPPTTAELGAAIRRLRSTRGVSIETLAGEAGIHDTWLSMIERGEGNPSWRTLGKLAEPLGVNVSDVALLAEKLRAESAESAL